MRDFICTTYRGEEDMAGAKRMRRRPGLGLGFGTIVACLGLVLTACQPGPEPSPTPSTPSATSTPVPDASVHFTAQGDISLGNGARKVLDVIAGLKPQLNLALGDLSYKAGKEQEFCDMVTGKLGTELPYQLLTGNHESDGRDGQIEKFARCLPNKLPGLEGDYGKQWRVDVPEQNPVVRFIMVSPGIKFPDGPLDYSPGSDRWRWTESAIDEAKALRIPWTVVGMHVPCLSIGNYDCLAGREFTNMLIEKKVDLVLSGHDHVYQRTYQLGVGAQCPRLEPAAFSQGCLADVDDTLEQGAGTVFVTVGVGGVGFYNIHNDDPEVDYFAAAAGKNQNPAFGTLDVTATPSELAARFVPAEGYNFTDSFMLQRK
ncbi:metallophosphoesterase [Arthrobacter oryzae]|nr:metallophosphoesterase [Arthrobacter oryzae]